MAQAKVKAKHPQRKRSNGMEAVFGALTTMALVFFLWTLVLISTATTTSMALAIGTSLQ